MKILRSVWTEFRLVPEHATRFWPPDGVWLSPWMQYQVFAPIFLLLCLNLFWYFLILRIAYKTLTQSKLNDIREEGEDDDEEVEVEESKPKTE